MLDEDIRKCIKRIKQVGYIHTSFYHEKLVTYHSEMELLCNLVDSFDEMKMPEVVRIHQSTIDRLRSAKLIDAAILLSQVATIIHNDGRSYNMPRVQFRGKHIQKMHGMRKNAMRTSR